MPLNVISLVAYEIKLANGRTKIAGKIIKIAGGELAFYRRHPLDKAEHHNSHTLSLDARIPGWLKLAGVRYVDHEARGVLYRISLEDFEEHHVAKIQSGAEGLQHYVDLDHWRAITPRPYMNPPHTPRIQQITGYAPGSAPAPRPIGSPNAPAPEAPKEEPAPRLQGALGI